MDEKLPCCMADAAKRVRRITLPSGGQVGIAGLDAILAEVSALHMKDELRLKAELLSRVKARNYVPRNAEEEYAEALLKAYFIHVGKTPR